MLINIPLWLLVLLILCASPVVICLAIGTFILLFGIFCAFADLVREAIFGVDN